LTIGILDRRAAPRRPPATTAWLPQANVRPGLEVCVVNLSAGGALLHCASPLRPGSLTELQLFAGRRRRAVAAVVGRCRVARLQPLVYEAALRFCDPLEDDQEAK
jgi:hypothetical protein